MDTNAPDKKPLRAVDFKKPETLRKKYRTVSGDDSPMSAYTLIGQLGLVVVLCIVGALGIGIYLDRLVGSKGPFTFVMLLIGIVAAAVSAWQLLKREVPWNR